MSTIKCINALFSAPEDAHGDHDPHYASWNAVQLVREGLTFIDGQLVHGVDKLPRTQTDVQLATERATYRAIETTRSIMVRVRAKLLNPWKSYVALLSCELSHEGVNP